MEVKIEELLSRYSNYSLIKLFKSGYAVSYNLFGGGFSRENCFEAVKITPDSVDCFTKYEGDLDYEFKLFIRRKFFLDATFKTKYMSKKLVGEAIVYEAEYDLLKMGEEYICSSLKTNLCLAENSEIKVNKELPDYAF